MPETLEIAHHPLPALLVLWPLLGAAAIYPLGKWRPDVRDWFMGFMTGSTLLGTLALIPLIAEDQRIGIAIPLLTGQITFLVDPFSMLFALFSSFVWFCATLFSFDYLHHEKNHDRYHTVSLIALSAMLGVVVAGDLITLYLFFETLGLIAFLFVIHTQTEKAKQASAKYIWMTILGGLALLAGIFLTFALGGDGTLAPLPMGDGAPVLRWTAFGLLLIGFGVKAGMLPVHVWLPDAHPVAPAPASALLSGVMIKAGAYGLFRAVTALFRPEVIEEASKALWAITGDLALVVLWAGIATMAVGVVLALGQHNAKRMLAYHSVSQMGFILVGIGTAGYLGAYGGMGLAGGVYHIVNHGLFKAALFLGIGAVVYRTGELDMYKLGGLWRKMPITFAFMLIAAAGITGVPLLNGFVSKCMIHHALVHAYELHHVTALYVAEKIFLVVCAGTACSFIKLIGFVFLGRPRKEYGPGVTDAPPKMLLALGLLGSAIIALGVWPQLLLYGVFAPGLQAWALSTAPLDYFLKKYFLSTGDLITTAMIFLGGMAIFVAGVKLHLFHLHAPKWFGVNHWYMALAGGLIKGCAIIQGWYEQYLVLVSRALRVVRNEYLATWSRTSRSWHRLLVTIITGASEPKTQRFINMACIALERERASCVRYSIAKAQEWLRFQGVLGTEAAQATIDAVRDIAAYMSKRQFNTRISVLAEVVRTGNVETARQLFDSVMRDIQVFRRPVAHVAIELAQRRMAGGDVLPEISSAVNSVISDERFDLRLQTAATGRNLAPSLLEDAAFRARHSLPGTYDIDTWHIRGVGLLEKIALYLVDLMRIVIEATTQERAGWALYERIDPASVTYTRKQIQRYARDMNFNMAMILLMFLLFMLGIVAGAR